ncbi:MAG: polyamine aminopropyltransferase [candidate division WOR-3 bacterium]|nr:polyamine aminopropyltransferase [candidate division WOR-3 bacterium]MCX7947028.1 polyamine aminopropyltransferase [candidate division WOR-3 bacterium]MDW8149931.1 polyamine aminopropyltransferase [candidate division WOR-3 bacterium]
MDSFIEHHSNSSGLYLKVNKILHSERSKYQEILVFENEFFGKVLVLDNLVMTTTKDEFIYHEMLAHVSLRSHPNPKNILIIGGGDGGTLREVLKYPINKVLLVEIDEKVIEVSKKFFSELSSSFNDKRVEVIIMDAIKWVKNESRKFDVILIDSTDPIKIAEGLISEEFLFNLKKLVFENSIVCMQSESPFYHIDTIRTIYQRFKKIFSNAYIYTAPIPTYPGGYWSFTISFQSLEYPKIRNYYFIEDLKFYHDEMYDAVFKIPKFLKDAIE